MPRIALSLVGKKFGKLTVIQRNLNPPKKDRNSWWFVQCDCGSPIKTVPAKYLQSGNIKSCGCGEHPIKHGGCGTPEYEAWKGMKSRCYNENKKQFKDWGGRGIIVCDRWIDSFENFLEDMGKMPGPRYSLERIDNNGNYEPSNCEWIHVTEQARNKTNNQISGIEEANEIRQKYKTGRYTHLLLSEEHGCSEFVIWSIVNNKTWI